MPYHAAAAASAGHVHTLSGFNLHTHTYQSGTARQEPRHTAIGWYLAERRQAAIFLVLRIGGVRCTMLAIRLRLLFGGTRHVSMMDLLQHLVKIISLFRLADGAAFEILPRQIVRAGFGEMPAPTPFAFRQVCTQLSHHAPRTTHHAPRTIGYPFDPLPVQARTHTAGAWQLKLRRAPIKEGIRGSKRQGRAWRKRAYSASLRFINSACVFSRPVPCSV